MFGTKPSGLFIHPDYNAVLRIGRAYTTHMNGNRPTEFTLSNRFPSHSWCTHERARIQDYPKNEQEEYD